MLSALFMVQTFFQLVSSVDAIRQLKITSAVFLIRDRSGMERYAELLLSSIERVEIVWISEAVESIPELDRMFYYRGVLDELPSRLYDVVFISRFEQEWMQVILAATKSGRVILLDDGLSTISSVNQYLSDDLVGVINSIFYSNHINKIKKLGLFSRVFSEINLFTIFPPKNYKNGIVVDNEFQTMRSMCRDNYKASNDFDILFIGQGAWVNKGLVSAKDYVSAVVSMAAILGGGVHYLPHKADGCGLLSDLRKSGVTIMTNRDPIELILARGDLVYSNVASFCSTAQYTLKIMFPTINIHMYRLSSLKINSVESMFGSCFPFDWFEHVSAAEFFIEPYCETIIEGL